MSLQNATSVVALVISLIALAVAIGQILNQLLGTESRYRRCNESVIGPWAELRHRRSKLKEFRVETTYVTPEIICCTPEELDLAKESSAGHAFRLVSQELRDAKPANDTAQAPSIRHREQFNTVRSGDIDVEKEGKDSATRSEMLQSVALSQQPAYFKGVSQGELAASWLDLLRWLHNSYAWYWPDECIDSCHIARKDADRPRKSSNSTQDPSHVKTETPAKSFSFASITDRYDPITDLAQDNDERTDIAIVYKGWTWDFMPPDLPKPLATSDVRDIIIFALRLGMQWRVLDPGNNRMSADGNGFSFQSLDFRGLGLVLKFTASSIFGTPPPAPPSRAMDKLICGIVPGDTQLVKHDWPIVRDSWDLLDDGRQIDDGPASNILSSLGCSREFREDLWRRRRDLKIPHFHNEIMALSLPFMPVHDCNNAFIHCAILHSSGAGWNWVFWQSPWALLTALRNHKRLHDDESLTEVYNALEHLRKTYSNDFLLRWSTSVIQAHGEGDEKKRQQDKSAMFKDLRQCHQRTTQWFVERGYHEVPKGNNLPPRCTLYMHLVAAHLNMVARAIPAALKSIEDEKKKGVPRSQEDMQKQYDLPPKASWGWFVHEEYLMATDYAKDVTRDSHGVVGYMRKRIADSGWETRPDGDFENAWWMLALRGILWDMSTIKQPRSVKPNVPSSMFRITTPVWII